MSLDKIAQVKCLREKQSGLSPGTPKFRGQTPEEKAAKTLRSNGHEIEESHEKAGFGKPRLNSLTVHP